VARVTGRHVSGTVAGGILAGIAMTVLFMGASLAVGVPILTIGWVFGWSVGYTALNTMTLLAGLVVHLIVSIVGALVFLGIVGALSRANLGRLSFTTYGRAAALGVIFGFVMWLVFWIPIAYSVLIPGFQAILGTATWSRVAPAFAVTGLVSHLVYGAVLAAVVLAAGGPIPSGRRAELGRPAAAPSATSTEAR
jgi:hypothetical protein